MGGQDPLKELPWRQREQVAAQLVYLLRQRLIESDEAAGSKGDSGGT
jgi:hypothetical protein